MPGSSEPTGPSGAGLTTRDANETVLRRYCEAWVKGDLASLVELYHDDLTLHYFGRSPLAGDHRGKQASLHVLGEVQQRAHRQLLTIHDVMASDSHGIVLAQERLERDGRVAEVRRLFLYHIRDGKLAEGWIYDEDQRLVDEFFS